MANEFAAAIAAAAASSPMGVGSVPITLGRVLLVDGDGLAYYCAGNDDTDAGEARHNLIRKVENAARTVGAERIILLLTASGSHKGHRYAIARRKPYQGQRANSRRPKNWQALRDYMQSACKFEVDATSIAEADDIFGWWAHRQPDDVVILTQDKDMRMLPGKHLDWVSNRMHTVACNEDSVFNDKQYGIRWFWLQMLHGDTADNIPGLPKYVLDGKAKPVGEVTASKLLVGDAPYHSIVAALYESFYGERWLVEMMEQACLLWMRRNPEAWDDCMNPGGPLEAFNDGEAVFAAAYLEIQQRVTDADNINAAHSEGAIDMA